MLEQLHCPNTICRAQLDEFDVAGETGYCPKCGECFRVTNGTLALTNKYGLDIPDLTQKRIDGELAVFREHERNCRGKLEDCKERLQWSTEKYAALPQPPAYLEVKKFNDDKWRGYAGVAFSTMGVAFLLAIPMSYLAYHIGYVNKNFGFGHGWGTWVPWDKPLLQLIFAVLFVWLLFIIIGVLIEYFEVESANGNRPQENARRQQKYERDLATAMRDAERVKEREDYRLQESIRKLNGIIESVHEKAESIRSEYTERVRRSQTNRY